MSRAIKRAATRRRRPRERPTLAVAAMVGKYALLTAAGVVFYLWGHKYALAYRGYEAVGGEVLLLGLPLVWFAVEGMIRDTAAQFRSLWKEAATRED